MGQDVIVKGSQDLGFGLDKPNAIINFFRDHYLLMIPFAFAVIAGACFLCAYCSSHSSRSRQTANENNDDSCSDEGSTDHYRRVTQTEDTQNGDSNSGLVATVSSFTQKFMGRVKNRLIKDQCAALPTRAQMEEGPNFGSSREEGTDGSISSEGGGPSKALSNAYAVHIPKQPTDNGSSSQAELAPAYSAEI